MKKESYRDYATAAYRLWAAAGRPSAEICRQTYTGAELADMLACTAAFAELLTASPEICRAVEAVYLVDPSGKLQRGDLTGRVLRFSMEEFISERQVWEWLAKARRSFARHRGLRV